jgi:outer membrane receptor protein involved in Fe transport
MFTKYLAVSSTLILCTGLVTSHAVDESDSTAVESAPLFQLPDTETDTIAESAGIAEVSEDGTAAFTIPDAESDSEDSTSDAYGMADPAFEDDESEDEVYHILPDFVVSAEYDRGYYSANSLAGTRTDGLIKDTPMTVSVVNSELMSDLNLYGIDDIAGLIAGAETEEDGFTNRAIRFRGFRSNFQLFEFMPRQISQDGYNVDRADVVRGANSLVYGQAAPGGKVNFLAKTAQFNKDKTSIETSVSDKDLFRVSFDHNQVINDKLAVRVMGVHEEREFNQDFKEKEFNGLTVEATYRPTEKTQIRLHLEGIDERRNNPAGTYIDKTGLQGMSGIPEGLPATPDIVDFLPNALLGSIFDAGAIDYYTRPDLNTNSPRPILIQLDSKQDIKDLYSDITPENSGTLSSPDEERNTDGFFFIGDITHAFTDDLQLKVAVMREEQNTELLQNTDRANLYGSLQFAGVRAAADEVGGVDAENSDRLFIKPAWQQKESRDETSALRSTLSWNTEIAESKQQILFGLDYDRRDGSAKLETLVYEDVANSGDSFPGNQVAKDYYQLSTGSYNYFDTTTTSNLTGNPTPSNQFIANGIGTFLPEREESATVETKAIWTAIQGSYMSSRLHTLVGVRFDMMNVQSSFSDIKTGSVGGAPNPSKREENYTQASPSIGALFWITPSWAIFANYAESIESPTGFSIDPEGDIVPPQTGKGFEYGFKFDLLDGKLNGQILSFMIEKENDTGRLSDIVLREIYPNLVDDAGNFSKAGANVAGTTVESKGYEADIYYNPTSSLSIFLGYAYLDTETTESPLGINDGSTVAGTSRHSATFTARYSFKDGALKGWYCGLSEKYRSKSFLGNFYEDIAYTNPKFPERNRIDFRDGRSDILPVTDGVTGEVKQPKKHKVYLSDHLETSVFVGWRGKLFNKSRTAPVYNFQVTVDNLFDAIDLVNRGSTAFYTENRTISLKASVQF